MPSLSLENCNTIEYFLQDHWTPARIVRYFLRDNIGSRTSIWRVIKRYRDTGTVERCKGGRPRVITPAMRDFVVEALVKRSDYWCEEVQEILLMEFDLWCCEKTISNLLDSEDFTNKMLSRSAEQRCPVARAMFEARLHTFFMWQLVYCDETYVSDRTALRTRGWAPKGYKAEDKKHLHFSDRYSLLPAYSSDGWLPEALIKPGSVTMNDFLMWIKSSVLPQMNEYPGRNSVLIMDNCSTHSRRWLKALCRDTRVLLLFLPPYSPDYNPIEKTFHLFKHWFRLHRDVMPSYGERNWRKRFEGFLQLGVANWDRGYDHAKIFRSCHVLDQPVDR